MAVLEVKQPLHIITVSEAKRLKIYNGYLLHNGHSPADTSFL
jgi:hypothetical protein